MGGPNKICSDKILTLTKNMMTVNEVWQGETISLEGEESYVMSYVSSHGKQQNYLWELVHKILMIFLEIQNSTEKAIIKMLDKFALDYHQLRENNCSDFWHWMYILSIIRMLLK